MSEQVRPEPVVSEAVAASWQRLLSSWPWIVGLLAMARALASPLALLHDPDTYMHIAAGRWMLAHGALPAADPFSFTMAGAHWVPGEWLGEVILAAVYGVAGWGGVIALTAVCFGAAIGLLTQFLLRRLEALPAVIAALAGMVLVLPHLLARPHIVALPLMVWWCGAVLAARDDGRAPSLAMLPVMALWANLHGSFLFGIALAGYLGAEAALRPQPGRSRLAEAMRWGGFVAAAMLVALADPNGVAAIVQPFRLMAMPALQTGFGEWQAADLREFPALALWLVGAAALLFVARRQLPWTRVALLLGLASMAVAHVRHADLLGLVGPLTIAAALGPRLAELMRPAAASPLLRGAALLGRPTARVGRLLVVILAALIVVPVASRGIDRAGDAVTPKAALAAARERGLAGPVLNSEAFGGYLIFAGLPTFIDGRIELYGNDFLAAYLAAERGDAAVLAGLLDRYHIAWTLLQAPAPAVGALDRLPGWHRVYADGQAVIHARD